MKVELRFRTISSFPSEFVDLRIEGPPDKVDELLMAVREAAKKWEAWEEK